MINRNTNPLVSIVVITYNYERFVGEAIDSALSQTYPNIEVLVVDDGSTDGTTELVKNRFGDVVSYIYRENGGLSAARNTGIERAHGDYLCFLDSDDIILPHFVQGHVEYLEKNNDVDILCANSEYFGQLKGIVRPQIFGKGDRYFTYLDLITENLVAGVHTVMMRKDVFTACGLFDEKISHSEDHEFWLRCARKVIIGYRDIVVARYRIHGKNHSMLTQKMMTSIERFLCDQLSKDLNEQEALAVKAELTYNAIREAWKKGYGSEARRLRRKYKDIEKVVEKPTWHFFFASFFPFNAIMGFRRFLGDVKVLSPLPKIESQNKD